MRLGFALPFADLAGGPLQLGSWADAARTAEGLGYSSVWTFDAIGRGFMLPDPLMALAAAGAATERLELGTGIMQLAGRAPAMCCRSGAVSRRSPPKRSLGAIGCLIWVPAAPS